MPPTATQKVTAKQVAARAGVSLAAVSRAFQNDKPLSEEKRRAVLKAAAELGYLAPQHRLFREQGRNIVVVLASELHNPFYPIAIEALSQALQEIGKEPLLYVLPKASDPAHILERIVISKPEAVVVLASTLASSLAKVLREAGIAVILFNRVLIDAESTAVTCDNHGGARLVAQRFVTQGRKRIGMVSGMAKTSTQIERAAGFRDGLAQAGQTLFCDWRGEFDYQTSYQLALNHLGQSPHPDALFCANDLMGLAVIDACRKLQIRVPEQVAIIGFDDIPAADWQSYRLTTIAQPLAEMIGQTIAFLGKALIGQDLRGQIRVFPIRLIERESG